MLEYARRLWGDIASTVGPSLAEVGSAYALLSVQAVCDDTLSHRIDAGRALGAGALLLLARRLDRASR